MVKKCFFLAALLAGLSNLSLNAQEIRVEPGNWWTGMKNQEVQVLVHAAQVGGTNPVIAHPGVTVKKIHRADSPNYLFVDLVISKSAKPGAFPIRFMKEGKAVYSYTYTLLARKKDAAAVAGFNSSDVIYLVTPDRFANGDTSNDVRLEMREKKLNRKNDYGRHGGDIRGMINQLDYIAGMGFTAIWPTPLLENDMSNASYHGYAITDFYKVDPRFGTLEEYKELADKARQRGIKLIFDGVANHSGSEYWWMKDLPFRNWINYPDSMRITSHRRTVNQDLYAADRDKELMVKGWFVRSMPDLNHDNTFLAKYILQNNIWWIETLGLAGIRQDTYPYSGKKFLEQWTCTIMDEYPGFSLVGEEWSSNPLIAAYWQQGKENKTGYKGCLKSTMDFPMQSALSMALTEGEGWDKGMMRLYEGLANDFVYANPKNLLVFGDNHDMDRMFTQYKSDPALLQMALAYLLTIRGIPQLYYGTEVLIGNAAKPGDHGLIRTDFPGGWAGDTVNGFTGAGLSPEQAQTKDFLKKLLNWRKKKTVIHTGNTLHYIPSGDVYVYFRYNKDAAVMVIMNRKDKPAKVNTTQFAQGIGQYRNGVNVISGEKVSVGDGDELMVPAKTTLILELGK